MALLGLESAADEMTANLTSGASDEDVLHTVCHFSVRGPYCRPERHGIGRNLVALSGPLSQMQSIQVDPQGRES